MEYLSREQILGASDIKTEDVEIPEWGGVVRVRGLSSGDLDLYREAQDQRNGTVSFRLEKLLPAVAARCTLDAQGNRLFTDADAEQLKARSPAALSRINEVAQRVSDLQEIGDLAKNSESALTDASPSGSPES